MSDADDVDEEPTILTVHEYLSRAVPTRGTLPTAVQDALEDYLLNTLNILDGAQVEALGAEGLASVYAEAVGDGHSPALVGIVKRWATPVTHAAVAGLLSPSRGVAASGLTDKTKSTRKADPRTSQMTKDLEKYGFESGTRQTFPDWTFGDRASFERSVFTQGRVCVMERLACIIDPHNWDRRPVGPTTR